MSESEQRSLQSMQTEVDDYIQQFKTGYFSPLGQMARLTEEVGELAREVNHYYGEKQKKQTKTKDSIRGTWRCLFVLISMANSLEIDLTEVLKKIWPNLTSGIAIALKERMGKHMIKIIVAGFKGRMGSTATQMVLETADFELVGVYDPHEAQETVSFNDETAIPFFSA